MNNETPQITVQTNKNSFPKGDTMNIKVHAENVEQYTTLQVDIYTAGTPNPSEAMGTGTQPQITESNTYQTELKLNNLPVGLYEIKLIRFHSLKGQEFSTDHKDFISGTNFERAFFEVIPEAQPERKKDEIMKEVLNKEKNIEDKFLTPIDIRTKINFCVFVLVKGLLIGTRTQYDYFEILPFPKGLGTKDLLECTNDFLSSNSKTNIIFNYSEINIPVSVIHFPFLTASSTDEVLKYCEDKSKTLLQVQALIRDGSGEIFDIVIYNRDTGEANRFTMNQPYPGNLLTGGLAGENPETILKYTDVISKDNTKKFLLELYKQAIAESNPDFQYVRFWQILEMLAERKNYHKEENLTNYEKEVLSRKTGEKKPWKINKAFSIVYNLLKNHGIGNSQSTEENVGIWLAFRNAVAHFGSIYKWDELEHKEDKHWAQIGIKKIQPTHDPVLFELKSMTNLILKKELNA